jgi:hypothetical protein
MSRVMIWTSAGSDIDDQLLEGRAEPMPEAGATQHLEYSRLGNRLPQPQLHEDPRSRVQDTSGISIVGITVGNESLPLRTDEPRTFLFRAHNTP